MVLEAECSASSAEPLLDEPLLDLVDLALGAFQGFIDG
jgi:hypothetical protein